MKTLIATLILCLATWYNAYSVPCVVEPCLSEEFPYFFCDNGTEVVLCSSNPYQQNNGGHRVIPLKMDFYCITYDEASYKAIKDTTIHIPQDPVAVYRWDYHDVVGIIHDTLSMYDGQEYYGIYHNGMRIYASEDSSSLITDYGEGDYILDGYYTSVFDHWFYPDPIDIGVQGNMTIFDTTTNLVVFDYTQLGSLFDQAKQSWIACCADLGTKNPIYLQTCCVHVFWSDSTALFSGIDRNGNPFDPTKTFAVGHGNPQGPGPNVCQYDCNDIWIAINQCDKFTGASKAEPRNYNHNFFITGSNSEQRTGNPWYNFASVLAHELGHIFGFGDQSSGACTRKSGSIMNNGDPSASGSDKGYNFTVGFSGLSADDCCMYKKMYCCMDAPFTGVEEMTETEMQFKIFPNPVNNLLNLQVINPNGSSINFEIISLLGTKELSGAIQPYEKIKTFNLETFESGIYMMVLNYDGKKEIRKFVINK